ncbi:hypothetical protein A2Z00_05425 [Candidatus Gottesmanbacteria bacterium RBG_13_45_10]|uniref:TraC-like domain-containing protein n=1 Tax=Candidatus Gottesmanbacteria bacterium RBG_13_45_10 TaxID=1798370 RepID=A0A1F5ZHI8_9BACT|nr:MAG: hypothetical protein A2Z00_05425 [Candidatus Gottesmanbacteria bacterium RBG_13_45_10]
MAQQTIVPIRSTTQIFTEIETVDRDIIMFADGSCCMIVSATAVNFGLLSEKEQDSIILSYAGLINSLSFPIQLLIRTQHKDVTAYLRLLEDQERKEKNPKLTKSIHEYRLFVAATVKEKDVLDKKFYIIVPFSSLELGISTKVFFGSKKRGLPYDRSYIYERALMVLTPKRDHVIRLLNRLGLQAKQLTNQQLIKLFFTTYNQDVPPPDEATVQKTIGK